MGGGCLLNSAAIAVLDRTGEARVSVVSGDGDRGGATGDTSVLSVRPGPGADRGEDAHGGMLAAGVAQDDWP